MGRRSQHRSRRDGHRAERQRFWRGQRQRAQAGADIEDLAARALDLGGRRTRRGLLDQLRVLEQRDQLAGIPGLATKIEIALQLLAAAARLQLELREPGVVRERARNLVEHMHEARVRVLLREDVVVVALHHFELLPHCIGRLRLLSCLRAERAQRNRVLTLLRERHDHCGERDGRNDGRRRPHLPAAPFQGTRSRNVRDEVELRGRGRRSRHDCARYRAPCFDLLARVVDDGPQCGGPVDTDCFLRCIAADDDGIEVELLGPERGVPVEIVSECLREILLDRGGQRELLAQHLPGAKRDDHFRRRETARGIRCEPRYGGATGREDRSSVASQRHFLRDHEPCRANAELGPPEHHLAIGKFDHRSHEAALERDARGARQQWGKLADPPAPEARQADAVCRIAKALPPVVQSHFHAFFEKKSPRSGQRPRKMVRQRSDHWVVRGANTR